MTLSSSSSSIIAKKEEIKAEPNDCDSQKGAICEVTTNAELDHPTKEEIKAEPDDCDSQKGKEEQALCAFVLLAPIENCHRAAMQH